MIDHISICVTDLDRSKAFYQAVLAPLGYQLLMEHPISGAGFGTAMQPRFWLREGTGSGPLHVAFASQDRSGVDNFYAAAIEAGATDNGRPGARTEYHPNYYGGFVKDFDGNNIEAVCHLPA